MDQPSTSKPWSRDLADSAAASYLDFLAEDPALLTDFLDPPTLAAVCSADPVGLPSISEACRKRLAEQDSDNSDDEDMKTEAREDGKLGPCKKSRGEPVNQAARNKACREKARREKINERFAELASLIDPGKEPKTDKPSILGDAIKFVQQLTVENHQLKQLNKFLEERVAQYERERGQQLYQQSMMMQSMNQASLMQANLGASTSMMPGTLQPHPSFPGQPAMPAQVPTAPLQYPQPLMAAPSPALMGHGQTFMSAAPQAPTSFDSLSFQQSSFQAMLPPNLKPPGVAGTHPVAPAVPTTAGMQVPPYWLQANMLDSTQDSLLRPPAA